MLDDIIWRYYSQKGLQKLKSTAIAFHECQMVFKAIFLKTESKTISNINICVNDFFFQ